MNYDRLPKHMQEGAKLYVEHGKLSGSFLTAILENDFVSAACNADHINLMFLHNWASWLLNDAPMTCWGSREAVTAWCDAGGLEGMKE